MVGFLHLGGKQFDFSMEVINFFVPFPEIVGESLFFLDCFLVVILNIFEFFELVVGFSELGDLFIFGFEGFVEGGDFFFEGGYLLFEGIYFGSLIVGGCSLGVLEFCEGLLQLFYFLFID